MGLKNIDNFVHCTDSHSWLNHLQELQKNTSTILDHILTNSTDKIIQVGTMDIGLSDHQLIYCTRKKLKKKIPKLISNTGP